MGATEIHFIIINFYTCGRAHRQTQTRLKALVYDILPSEEGAAKRCSERCAPDRHYHSTLFVAPPRMSPPTDPRTDFKQARLTAKHTLTFRAGPN